MRFALRFVLADKLREVAQGRGQAVERKHTQRQGEHDAAYDQPRAEAKHIAAPKHAESTAIGFAAKHHIDIACRLALALDGRGGEGLRNGGVPWVVAVDRQGPRLADESHDGFHRNSRGLDFARRRGVRNDDAVYVQQIDLGIWIELHQREKDFAVDRNRRTEILTLNMSVADRGSNAGIEALIYCLKVLLRRHQRDGEAEQANANDEQSKRCDKLAGEAPEQAPHQTA